MAEVQIASMTDRPNRVFTDAASDLAFRARWYTSRAFIYGALIFWSVVCLFPIYWTVTTSFKIAPDVMQGNLVPWFDFAPQWRGWRSQGLSLTPVRSLVNDVRIDDARLVECFEEQPALL